MAVYTGVVLVAVLVASGGVGGEQVGGQRLTFTPSTIVDRTTSTLTVRCDVSIGIFFMNLYKGNTLLATNGGPEGGIAVERPFRQRATAAGSLDPPAYLAVTFNANVSCSDAGDYRCEYAEAASHMPSSVNGSLPATSNPANIEMAVRPSRPTYKVNDLVELECAGEVGKPAVGTWRWETRDVTDGSSWTPIQQTDDNSTASGVCQLRGKSMLRFQVQLEDDNRMYRCSFRNDQYSANFTFRVRDTQCQATAQGLSTGSAVALAVVLTFFLTLGGTLCVACRYIKSGGGDVATESQSRHGTLNRDQFTSW